MSMHPIVLFRNLLKYLAVCVTCTLIFCPVITFAKVEEWESNEGHKITAEFVRINQGSVELIKENGDSVNMPLVRLSDASQKRAEALWEIKAQFLPHHVFQMQTYDFALLKDGKMQLQPKHAALPQGDLIPIRFNGGYIPSGGRWKARPIVQRSEPEVSETSLTLKMDLVDDIQVTVQCELAADTLTIGYQFIEPAGVEKGSYQVILLTPAILETNLDTHLMQGPFLNQPVPFAAIGSHLDGISLRAVAEKRTENIPYTDSPDKFKGRQEYVLIKGALGRNSKLKVEAGKNGYITHLIYPWKMLWSGYNLFLEKNSDQDAVMGSSNEFILSLTY